MTKRSQCSRCGTGDGVHCRYYRPLDDSDCPQYMYDSQKEEENYPPEIKLSWKNVLITCAIILIWVGVYAYLKLR